MATTKITALAALAAASITATAVNKGTDLAISASVST
jgi:hypothetical protein